MVCFTVPSRLFQHSWFVRKRQNNMTQIRAALRKPRCRAGNPSHSAKWKYGAHRPQGLWGNCLICMWTLTRQWGARLGDSNFGAVCYLPYRAEPNASSPSHPSHLNSAAWRPGVEMSEDGIRVTWQAFIAAAPPPPRRLRRRRGDAERQRRRDTEPQVPTSLADKSNLSPRPLTPGGCHGAFQSRRRWVHAGIAPSRVDANMGCCEKLLRPPPPPPPPSSLIHKSIFVHFMLFWTHLLKPELMCCSRFLLCFCSVVLIPVRKLSSLQPRVHLWCALRKKCDSLHKKQLKSASFCSARGHVWCLFSGFTLHRWSAELWLTFTYKVFCSVYLPQLTLLFMNEHFWIKLPFLKYLLLKEQPTLKWKLSYPLTLTLRESWVKLCFLKNNFGTS